MAKRVYDLATEDLQTVLSASRKRVRSLEQLIAKRTQESDTIDPCAEPRPSLPCMTCCDHVWRSRSTGPRDNGDMGRAGQPRLIEINHRLSLDAASWATLDCPASD